MSTANREKRKQAKRKALKVPADPRLAEVVQTGEKALAKKAEVEGAGSVAEVEEVSWTP